jgi:hypothetical protein
LLEQLIEVEVVDFILKDILQVDNFVFCDFIVVGFRDFIVVGFRDFIVVGFRDFIVGFRDFIVVGFRDFIVVGFRDFTFATLSSSAFATLSSSAFATLSSSAFATLSSVCVAIVLRGIIDASEPNGIMLTSSSMPESCRNRGSRRASTSFWDAMICSKRSRRLERNVISFRSFEFFQLTKRNNDEITMTSIEI